MTSTHMTETKPELNHSSLHALAADTGWQRQGKLWSDLKELCDLLRVQVVTSVNDEEFLFQHVQFKTGQNFIEGRATRVRHPFGVFGNLGGGGHERGGV